MVRERKSALSYLNKESATPHSMACTINSSFEDFLPEAENDKAAARRLRAEGVKN
jgi:hypothetical protein